MYYHTANGLYQDLSSGEKIKKGYQVLDNNISQWVTIGKDKFTELIGTSYIPSKILFIRKKVK